MSTEDENRDSPIRHRWALLRFAQTLIGAEDEDVREAAWQLIEEMRGERYPGEFYDLNLGPDVPMSPERRTSDDL